MGGWAGHGLPPELAKKSCEFRPTLAGCFPGIEVTVCLYMHSTQSHGARTMNATNDKKPKLTADAAYENAHLVAQDLVERIRELLFDMPAPGNEEHPIHWGHV